MRSLSCCLNMTIKFGPIAVLTLMLSFFTSCHEENSLKTVESVDLQKYQGKWFEISRFPNSFEKDLECVTAEYTLKTNGKVKVVNRGKNSKTGKWKESVGTAKVADEDTNAKLKVSFFWPFYGDYWILKLDEDYRHVLVGAPNMDYLWVLSRDSSMSEDDYQMYVDHAEALGFDVSRLEKTNWECN